METKITNKKSETIVQGFETIRAIHVNLCYEWRRDLNKEGYLKFHSKLYKAMKYAEETLYYMSKMYEILELK